MKEEPIAINLQLDTVAATDILIKVNGRKYRLVAVVEQETTHSSEVFAAAEADSLMLNAYVNQLVNQLRQNGRNRTAETYRCALNSLLRFLPASDIELSRIDAPLMHDYERYLQNRGLQSNSSSFYMRVLRTIYNHAVSDGLIADKHPFAKVYTGIGRTEKRAMPIDIIQQLRNLTHLSIHEAFARDIFLFSFYTRGMAFIDIAYLSPENIQNGILTYRRHKTGQQISMRWEPQMQEIVECNPTVDSHFLLPIIKRKNGHERSQYRECQRVVNSMLHQLERKLELGTKLTFYVARHSWASIARSMNMPLNLISASMGHTSERTTQIYLKSLDNDRLDTMSANIIKAVEEG